MEELGVQWTRDSIIFGTKTFHAATHAPVLIHPNPESPDRYVVVNAILPERRIQRSGSTTQMSIERPIGDFSVVDVAAGAESGKLLVLGGFFNESWQLEMRQEQIWSSEASPPVRMCSGMTCRSYNRAVDRMSRLGHTRR